MWIPPDTLNMFDHFSALWRKWLISLFIFYLVLTFYVSLKFDLCWIISILQAIHLVYCSNGCKKECLMHQQLQSWKEWKKWLSLIPLKNYPNNLGSSYSEVFSKSVLLMLPFENPYQVQTNILQVCIFSKTEFGYM